MSNDVERLAKVVDAMAVTLIQLLSENHHQFVGGREYAEEGIKRIVEARDGATLPTPPRATPLEAAARSRWPYYDDMSDAEKREVKASMTHDLTAAVGALSDEDVRQIGQAYVTTPFGTSDADRTRAALLALLTEGGAA